MGRVNGRLDGKVALISGAARGMGRAEARLFAAEGAKVAVCDVVDGEGKSVAEEIGASAIYLHLDVTSEDDWAAAVAATTERFGKLNVLVNNAGIAEGAPLAVTTLESYRRVIDVNQIGVFLGMRAVVEAMTAAGGGSILNISSIDGMVGMNFIISYVASKWAVRGMTKVAAQEFGEYGIRVNSIHPGLIDTAMLQQVPLVESGNLDRWIRRIPLGRIAEADEVAKLALFLASDESSYSSGCEFLIDGGMTA